MTSIRAANPDDIPAVARLLAQLFEQELDFAPDYGAQVRGLKAIMSDPRIGTVLVAERSGELCGTVNLLYTVSTALGGPVALLEDLVIARFDRRAGIGAKLLAEAIETARARGCLRISLLTDADNETAQTLYTGFGFRKSTMVPFRLALARTLTT